MMTRAQKSEEISAISERFGRANAAFVVDFKGMNVEEVTAFRKKLNPAGAEMKVVRNTLARLALKDHPDVDSAISGDFLGTNALIFAYEDVGAVAKTMSDFSKGVEELVVKSGYMDGQALDQAKIKYLSDLPSKEVLQAQLLGVLQAPMSKFLATVKEVPQGFARVLGAYKDTK